MKLDLQKTLASKVTGAGKSRINIDFEHRDKIKEAGCPVTIRYKKGQDITAACGQLGESGLK